GISSENITLAFVTKNGNITYDDVFLEGKVEVGKTLLVKGAAHLLDALQVDGELSVLGDAVFSQNVSVTGDITARNAFIKDFITARVVQGETLVGTKEIYAPSIHATDSLRGQNLLVDGQSVFQGYAMFNSGLWAKSGSFQDVLEVGGDFGAFGKQINLGTAGSSKIVVKGSTFTYNGASVCTTSSGGCGTESNNSGWTDDGTVVRLTTSTDIVGIGTTSPWDGASLAIEQNGTSTLFVIGDSGSSSPFFYVTAKGVVSLGSTSPTGILNKPGDLVIGSSTLTAASTQDFNDLFVMGGVGIGNATTADSALEVADRIVVANSGFISGSKICTASNGVCASSSATSTFSTFDVPTVLANKVTSTSTPLVFNTLGSTDYIGAGTTSPWGFFSIDQRANQTRLKPVFVVGDDGTTTPFIFVSQKGVVGFGTSTPTDLLLNPGDVAIGRNGATSDLYVSGGLGVGNATTGDSDFVVATSSFVVLTRSGDPRIGIGTLAPRALLEVAPKTASDDSTTPGIRINNSASGQSILSFAHGGTEHYRIRSSGSSALFFEHDSAGDFDFTSNGVDRLRITSTGTIGVGSSTPWGQLTVDQIADHGRLKPIFVVGDNGTTSPFIFVSQKGVVSLGSTSPTGLLNKPGDLVIGSSTLAAAGDHDHNDVFIMGGLGVGNATTSDGNLVVQGRIYVNGGTSTFAGGVYANDLRTNLISCNGAGLLETDALGAIVCGTDAGASSGVSGTGALGQVAYWSASDTITGSNNFFFDTSNNRIGIGDSTTTPWGTLSVDQTSAQGRLKPIFVVADNGTTSPFIFVSQKGVVGFGTSTPTDLLLNPGDVAIGRNGGNTSDVYISGGLGVGNATQT
ncbi:MAG: hypothetical protein HY470_00855, partial [Candidatus Ryanbacteria bacterium]|nr:hypothetical protein [Candidatus Ryanbacteria bacterium]